jgi:hypothetical protein
MNLWIANNTTANHMFVYRLQERQQVFAREIKKGQQIKLADLSQDEVERITKQHERYGMVPWKEAHKRKDVVGLVYSTEGPVNMDALLGTFEKNSEIKDDEAQKRRVTTAAAIAENIGNELGKMNGSPMPPVRLEVEVTESQDGKLGGSSGVEVIANPAKTQPRRTLSRAN